jgi:ABC-type lipopolysaccharide export system ATPase subunit
VNVDDRLAALALVQLVARMQAEPDEIEARREELDALLTDCNVEQVALHLANMLLSVAETARFPLAALLAAERRDLLDPPPDTLGA